MKISAENIMPEIKEKQIRYCRAGKIGTGDAFRLPIKFVYVEPI